MEFEWDASKDERNLKKHGVSFQEAATVFGDPFGQATSGRFLVVSHTDRGDRTRIISARRMSRAERKQYEEDQR